MRQEKTCRPQRERWPRRSGKWLGFGRQWSLPAVVLILMAALYCSGCGATKKMESRSELERQATELRQSEHQRTIGDTAGGHIRALSREMIPGSEATMGIHLDSLLRLPEGAGYTERSGQATARVERRGAGIQVTATCDSLAREIEYYEDMYYRARDELDELEHRMLEERAQREKRESLQSNASHGLLGNPIMNFIMGFLGGALTITAIIIYKREKK